MPGEQQQFELHAALERDIARLSEEIGRHREKPEFKEAAGRELIRESLKSFPPLPAAPSVSTPQTEEGSNALLPSYMKDDPAEIKLRVEKLLELALHNGLGRGLTEARKAGSYVLDAFHDSLIDKLYPELKKRGVVE